MEKVNFNFCGLETLRFQKLVNFHHSIYNQTDPMNIFSMMFLRDLNDKTKYFGIIFPKKFVKIWLLDKSFSYSKHLKLLWNAKTRAKGQRITCIRSRYWQRDSCGHFHHFTMPKRTEIPSTYITSYCLKHVDNSEAADVREKHESKTCRKLPFAARLKYFSALVISQQRKTITSI